MRWDPLQRTFLVYRGGGDPPPQTSTTNVNQMYSPEEAARRAKLMAEAERIYGQTQGMAQNANIGQMSDSTRLAQEMMRRYASTNPGANIAAQLGDATTFGFNAAMDPTSAPGFQATLDTALRKVNEQYTGPTGPFAGIRRGFNAANSGGGGSREGIAMGMAGRDYLSTIGDVTGRLTSDAYTKGLDVFSRTMALAPQNMQAQIQAGMLPANILGAVGQQEEAYDEKAARWDLEAPWAALGPYASTVHGMSSPGTETTSTVPGPRANPMAPLGAAMMGGTLGSMAGFGPQGMLIGAGAGLLLSLFD